MVQKLENLPREMLVQKRFIPTRADKHPLPENWQIADNWLTLEGCQRKYPHNLYGFVCHEGGTGREYVLIDFDHVLNDDGTFVNDNAENCYNSVVKANPAVYVEKSISGRGLHVFAKINAGDLPPDAKGVKKLYFSDKRGKDADYVEVFIHTDGRYCLVTGALFNFLPDTGAGGDEILKDDTAITLLKDLLAQIDQQQAADNAKRHKTRCNAREGAPKNPRDKIYAPRISNPQYERDLLYACLDYLDPAAVAEEYNDWLAVTTAWKNVTGDYAKFDEWCQRDRTRYDAEENLEHWDSVTDAGFDASVIIGKARAAGFDFKTFARDWHAAHPAPPSPPAADLNCPVEGLSIPAPYELTAAGVLFKGRCICPTPLIISKYLRSDEHSDGDGNFIELAYRDSRSKQWHGLTVSKSTISNHNKILALAATDIAVTSTAAKSIVDYLTALLYLNDNVKIIPVQTLYHQLGWHGDTFVYPNSDAAIAPAAYDPAAFTTAGNFDDWRNFTLEALKKSTAVRLVFGAALAAPILHFLGTENQWLHLTGRSGSGKTAAIFLAASIYGNPSKYTQTLDATTAGLEANSILFNDLPHMARELQTASKSARENLDRDIYKFGEGISRQRCNRDGSMQKRRQWRGVRITDGEQKITNDFSGEGAIKRALEFTCTDVFDNDFARTVYHFTAKNHGLAGKLWIDALQHHKDDIRTAFDRHVRTLELQFPDTYPNHRKIIAAAYAAAEVFEQVVLRPADDARIFTEPISFCHDVNVIIATLRQRSTSSNADRARDKIAEYFNSHKGDFRWIDETGDVKIFEGEPVGRAIFGYELVNDDLAIYPTALRVILQDFPDADAIIAAFAADGTIIAGTDKSHKFQKAVKIERKTVWLTVFRHARLFED